MAGGALAFYTDLSDVYDALFPVSEAQRALFDRLLATGRVHPGADAGGPRSLPGQLAGPRPPGRGGALPPRRRFGHLGGWGDPPPDPQLRAPPARKRHDASSHERGGGGDRVPPELRLGGEPEGQVPDRAQVLRGRPPRCREKRDPPLPSLSR